MGVLATVLGWFGGAKPTGGIQAANGSAAAAVRPSDGHGVAKSEPRVSFGTDWNPSLLRNVSHWTDSGDLRYAAELCDSLLGDDRIASAFATRCGGLLGSSLTFETSTASGAIARRRAAKALEAGEDWWTIFEESELRLLLTWGLILGVGFGQLIWETHDDHGGRLIPRLKVWHPRWFRWSYENQTWLRYDSEKSEWIKIKAGSGEWVVYCPSGSTRPWAHGLWRGLALLWLLKTYAIRDWARRSEAHGQPAWVITSTIDNHAHRRELVDLFGDLGRNPAVGMPNGFDVRLVEATANTAEIFERQVNLANTGFAVAITGGNLTIEVNGSQKTGATAQTLVRIDYKRNDATSLSTLANTQVLTWWAEWNFSDAKAAPWPIWNVEPPNNTAALANTWLTVAKSLSAFRLAGIHIDLALTAERFNIPITGMVELPQLSPTTTDDQSADDSDKEDADGEEP